MICPVLQKHWKIVSLYSTVPPLASSWMLLNLFCLANSTRQYVKHPEKNYCTDLQYSTIQHCIKNEPSVHHLRWLNNIYASIDCGTTSCTVLCGVLCGIIQYTSLLNKYSIYCTVVLSQYMCMTTTVLYCNVVLYCVLAQIVVLDSGKRKRFQYKWWNKHTLYLWVAWLEWSLRCCYHERVAFWVNVRSAIAEEPSLMTK